jgi:arginine deiminase
MAKKKNSGSDELIFDYKMFDEMSKNLKSHSIKVISLRKEIARNKKASVVTKAGIIESLSNIIEHMENANKEIKSAKSELKRI